MKSSKVNVSINYDYWDKLNPFNDNHLFNKKDIERAKLTKRDRLACIFHPMQVMIQPEGVYFFKTRRGQYYYYKFEPPKPLTETEGNK